MSQFGRTGVPGAQARKAAAVAAAVVAVLWAGVLVSTVTVLVRLEPAVPLSLGMSSWSASADSDTMELAVASSQPWAATGGESWLSVSPVSGDGSEVVQLTAAPNDTSGDRSATLTVTSAGNVRSMTVYQGAMHPEGVLDLDVTDWDVGVEGGATVVAVTGAQAWTAGADADWISAQSDLGAGTLTLTATENTGSAPRSTLVTVADGTTSIAVTVNQAGQVEATLTLGAWRWTPGAGASSLRVPVTSDQTWTVGSTQRWASVDPESGTGDGTITIRVQRNTATASRTATVQVAGGGMTRVVHVLQAGAPRPVAMRSPTPAPSKAPNSPTIPNPVKPPADPPVVKQPVDPPVVDPPVVNPPVDPPVVDPPVVNPPVDPPVVDPPVEQPVDPPAANRLADPMDPPVQDDP